MREDQKIETGLDAVKAVVGLASGIGVGAIVAGIVNQAVPSAKLPMRICLMTARMGLSSAVAIQVEKANNDTIDYVVKTFKKTKADISEAANSDES